MPTPALLTHQKANLNNLPTQLKGLNTERIFTIGDLHGSVAKLIWLCFREGIILQKENARNINSVYEDLLLLEKDDSTIDSDTDAYCNRMEALIDQLKVEPKSVHKLIFIGDILSDRRGHDGVMLHMLRRLNESKLNYIILIGNHDAGNISAAMGYEPGLSPCTSISRLYLDKNLKPSFKRHIGTAPKTCLPSYHDNFLSHTRLFHYENNTNGKLSVWTHANIRCHDIIHFAGEYHIKTPSKLTTVEQFEALVKSINSAYHKEGPLKFAQIKEDTPFNPFWRTTPFEGDHKPIYIEHWIHGHCDSSADSITIDDKVAKDPYHYTQQTSLTHTSDCSEYPGFLVDIPEKYLSGTSIHNRYIQNSVSLIKKLKVPTESREEKVEEGEEDAQTEKLPKFNTEDNNGYTFIQYALRQRQYALMRALVQYDRSLVTTQTKHGNLLHLLAKNPSDQALGLTSYLLNKFKMKTLLSEKDDDHKTPLHYAIQSRDKRQIREILKHGEPGKEILLHAIKLQASEEILDLLFDHPVNIDAIDTDTGGNIFHFIIEHSDYNQHKLIQKVLFKIRDTEKIKTLINQPDYKGQTPIMSVAKYYPALINFMVENHADPRICDPFGINPLMILVQNNQECEAKALLDKLEKDDMFQKRTDDGSNVIHIAAINANAELMTALLKKVTEDIDIIQAEQKDGQTPIELACRYGHLENVQLLRNAYSRLLSDEDFTLIKEKLFVLGIQQKHIEISIYFANLLCFPTTHIAEIIIQPEYYSPLMLCNLLKEGFLNIEDTCEGGVTWLQKIMAFLDKKTFEDILEITGDLDIETLKQALKNSIQYGNYELSLYLIKTNSEVLHEIPLDAQENTILHLAAQAGNSGIIELLLSYFLDKASVINLENTCGETPYDIAFNMGHATVCTILLKQGYRPSHPSAKWKLIMDQVNTNMFDHLYFSGCPIEEKTIWDFMVKYKYLLKCSLFYFIDQVDTKGLRAYFGSPGYTDPKDTELHPLTLDPPILHAARHQKHDHVIFLLSQGEDLNYINNSNNILSLIVAPDRLDDSHLDCLEVLMIHDDINPHICTLEIFKSIASKTGNTTFLSRLVEKVKTTEIKAKINEAISSYREDSEEFSDCDSIESGKSAFFFHESNSESDIDSTSILTSP